MRNHYTQTNLVLCYQETPYKKIQVLFQLCLSSLLLGDVSMAIPRSYIAFTSKQCSLLTNISLTKAALTRCLPGSNQFPPEPVNPPTAINFYKYTLTLLLVIKYSF